MYHNIIYLYWFILYLCFMKETFLKFISDAGRIKYKKGTVLLVKCLCICGKEVIVRKPHFMNHHTVSCGCYQKKRISESTKKHGMSNTRTYRIWASMITRCSNKNTLQYHRYGGRGVSVCEDWKLSFNNFFMDMGSCPSNKHSIDRIDNNGNYEKNNCKWSNGVEQCSNKSNNTKYIYNGEYLTVTEISRRTGILRSKISNWKNRSKYSAEKIEKLIKENEKST